MNQSFSILFNPIVYNVLALIIFFFVPKTTMENMGRKIVVFLISIPVIFNIRQTGTTIINLPQNINSIQYFWAYVYNSLVMDLLLPLIFAEILYAASKIFMRGEDEYDYEGPDYDSEGGEASETGEDSSDEGTK